MFLDNKIKRIYLSLLPGNNGKKFENIENEIYLAKWERLKNKYLLNQFNRNYILPKFWYDNQDEYSSTINIC